MKYTDPDGRAEMDYKICEAVGITVGAIAGMSSGNVLGGVIGAIKGYKNVKALEDYNGPQRDAANQNLVGENPQNPKGNDDFTKLSDSESAFHQLDDGSKVSKYVSTETDKNGGTGEIVWNDTKNELVKDPKARGTYNYGSKPISHAIKDILPWVLLGTGKDDPSNMFERAFDMIKAIPDYVKGNVNNED